MDSVEYAEYLRSDLWAGIRRRVFEAKGKRCYCCRKKAVLVHHASYSENVLAGRTLKPLWPLCHHCHEHIHAGRSLDEANAKMHELASTRGAKTRVARVARKRWSRKVAAMERDRAFHERMCGS